MTQTIYIACRLAPIFFHGFFSWQTLQTIVYIGPHLAGDFFHSFLHMWKKTVKKSGKPFPAKRDVETVDPRKSEKRRPASETRGPEQRWRWIFSNNIGKKMALPKNSQLRIIRWQNAFSGKQKNQAKCETANWELLPLLFGWFIDSTVPFLGGVHNVWYVPGRHYLLGNPR